jgi:hypothetical protein
MNDVFAPQRISAAYYQAYLVRLWRNKDDEPWRVIVTHVLTGEVRHFLNLAAFLAHIEGEQNPISE